MTKKKCRANFVAPGRKKYTYVLVPVGGDDVPVGWPEPLDLSDVDLVLVEVGNVLSDVELTDGHLVKVLTEAGRVHRERLDRADQVRELAVQVVKVHVAGLLKKMFKILSNFFLQK